MTYKNCKLRDPMRLDILVDSKVIIEVKATETVLAVHKAQVLTYLRLTNLKLGLVINFGQGRLIDGWNSGCQLTYKFLCVSPTLRLCVKFRNIPSIGRA